MKTIELTDEMYDSLMELSKELNTQDNRCKASPIYYQIQTNEEVCVPDGNGNMCYYFDGKKYEGDIEINEAVDNFNKDYLSKKNILELDDWEKGEILKEAGFNQCFYEYEHKYQNVFLTEKACRAHIAANKYHYNEPVDYVNHSFRNPELEMVLKFITSLNNK